MVERTRELALHQTLEAESVIHTILSLVLSPLRTVRASRLTLRIDQCVGGMRENPLIDHRSCYDPPVTLQIMPNLEIKTDIRRANCSEVGPKLGWIPVFRPFGLNLLMSVGMRWAGCWCWLEQEPQQSTDAAGHANRSWPAKTLGDERGQNGRHQTPNIAAGVHKGSRKAT